MPSPIVSVVAFRCFRADVPETDVTLDRFRVAVLWIAHAAAARHRNDHTVTGGHDLQSFRSKFGTRRQPHRAFPAWSTAIPAPCRIFHPLERGEQSKRGVLA